MIQQGVPVQHDYRALQRKYAMMLESRTLEIQELNNIIESKDGVIKLLEAENKVLRQRKEKKMMAKREREAIKRRAREAKRHPRFKKTRKGWIDPRLSSPEQPEG